MPSPSLIVLATHNQNKVREIQTILGAHIDVRNLDAYPHLPKIEETGTTFLENARLKAIEISKLIDPYVLADDSGLEVDALQGAPGVYSSSYGGEEGNHQKNNQRLLEEMTSHAHRTARFQCTLVLAKNGKEIGVYRGSVEGTIASQISGTGGFGYDPLFIPSGHSKTFADLDSSIKNTLSHRAKAIQNLLHAINIGEVSNPS